MIHGGIFILIPLNTGIAVVTLDTVRTSFSFAAAINVVNGIMTLLGGEGEETDAPGGGVGVIAAVVVIEGGRRRRRRIGGATAVSSVGFGFCHGSYAGFVCLRWGGGGARVISLVSCVHLSSQ